MDIKQLIYFISIVKENNITKAAEKLHVSQPSVSKFLRMLEEELNVSLIERNTRNFKITDAGRILLHRAEQVVELLETTVKEVKNYSERFKGTLSIGTIPSSGVELLPERLDFFHKNYPSINFEIREGDTYKILELLANGKVEIGLVRTPFNSESYESIWLPDEPMVAVYNDNWYFDETEQYLSPIDLLNKPLIVDRRFEKLVASSCQQAGFKPRIICESEDARSVLLWSSTGIGVGLMPKSATKFNLNPNLKCKEIDEPFLKTRTAIIWMKNGHLSNIANCFLDTFKL